MQFDRLRECMLIIIYTGHTLERRKFEALRRLVVRRSSPFGTTKRRWMMTCASDPDGQW